MAERPLGYVAQMRQLRARNAELEARNAQLGARVVELEAARTAEVEARIAELEAALERYRDPWQQRIADWLAAHPNDYRLHTTEIIEGALQIPNTSQDIEAWRRVGKIMDAIGGWKPSENVVAGGVRGRGYIRRPYKET